MPTTKKTSSGAARKKTTVKKSNAVAARKQTAAKKSSAGSARKKTSTKKSTTKRTSAGAARKKTTAKKPARRKYSPTASATVQEEMHEFREGKLRSGRSGKKVTNPKQAIAIGLSEARRAGKKVPPNPNRSES
jgi:hypothetical protein